MAISILEARVDSKQWDALEQAYKEATAAVPPQLSQSFLLQDTDDTSLWRLVTVYASGEHVPNVRAGSEDASGAQVFRAAGVDPVLRVYNVVSYYTRWETDREGYDSGVRVQPK